MLGTPNLKDDILLLNKLLNAASVETLKYFRSKDLLATNKEKKSFDPVTEADREAERVIRDMIIIERPQDGVLGEELSPIKSNSDRVWVVDPIDGTRSYISGVPVWGTLIALSNESGPILGAIDQPFTGERFIGSPNGAFLTRDAKTEEISTRECASLADAVLFSTHPEIGTISDQAQFQKLSKQVKLTRYGLDCYAYGLLAMGQIDLVVEAELKVYDVQGPIAVVQAAGGVVTNWQGEPAHMGGRLLAAGCPKIHAQALKILNSGIS